MSHRISRVFVFDRQRRHDFDETRYEDPVKAERIQPIIAAEKPDLIISYTPTVTRILLKFVKCQCPVITMCHMNPEKLFENMSKNTKDAMEECACVQVLLPGFIDSTKTYFSPKKIISIPNVVPSFEKICDCAAQHKIITVGRIERNSKRHHLLIKAIHQMGKDIPEDWTTEIYGSWAECGIEYFEECQSLIKKYALENKISFCGTTHDVCGVFQTAAIYAQPSAYEGFPLAMTEAMSAGLPVVAYQKPGIEGIVVNGRNGFLCEDGIEDFAEKLLYLIRHEDKRREMGRNAHEDMKQYRADVVWDQWEDLIHTVYREYNT